MGKFVRMDGPRALLVNSASGLKSNNCYTTFVERPFDVEPEDEWYFEKKPLYRNLVQKPVIPNIFKTKKEPEKKEPIEPIKKIEPEKRKAKRRNK